MGRPLKLTPDVRHMITSYIRAGAFDWVAAEAAGVSGPTFYRWQQQGRKPRARRLFREFREGVRRAHAEARVAAEARVYQENPFPWLRYGPGRERAGEPG